jgi:hypothetical protein
MEEVFETQLPRKVEITRTLVFFAWYAGAACAIWLFGIVIALPAVVLLYSLLEGGERWWVSLLLSGCTYLFIWGLFEQMFKIVWPTGYLFL